MTGPRVVCIGCETREIGLYELLCPSCRQTAEEAGLISPETSPTVAPERRIQIGPTDV